MKQIELTEKHKTKLLEMCEVLFSEFNEWRFGKVTAEGNLEDFYNKTKNLSWEDKEKHKQSCDFLWIEKDFKYEHDDDIERSETWVIHWFEFCMTHLVNKLELLCKLNLIHSFYSFNEQINSNEHIIDYLYEEFKKLK
jgi:hypothetical protein